MIVFMIYFVPNTRFETKMLFEIQNDYKVI